MSTYAIGDIQGCYDELQLLLDKINFDRQTDQLWFVGDVVNRGPKSLETLRFIKGLGSAAKLVLGNHDIHLLAIYYGARQARAEDTLNETLAAPDAKALMKWLLFQPLFHHDAKLQYSMVHAGLAPQWDLTKAQSLSDEWLNNVAKVNVKDFLAELFSDPIGSNLWHEHLTGVDRMRCISNYFTRIRFCDADGNMDLKTKGPIDAAKPGFMPWFKVPGRITAKHDIVFGHWAMLRGESHTAHTYALDTGCAWGESLTAMRLEDRQRFSVHSLQAPAKGLPD
jgi:bis(5'-nucleosyl)-tetraphosphatase (symmetrical)